MEVVGKRCDVWTEVSIFLFKSKSTNQMKALVLMKKLRIFNLNYAIRKTMRIEKSSFLLMHS